MSQPDPQTPLAEAPSPNARVIVDVGDMKVVKSDRGQIITHALGSCIGVAIYDPVAKVGGMLHYVLPDSRTNPAKAEANPCMFADTGIPHLFREAYKLGAEKSRLIVKLAGGGNVLDRSNYFNIGKKNYLAARKILYRNGVLIKGEFVGGTSGKTLRLQLDSGDVSVRMPDGEERSV
jgi:chemotaxis protein CheD